VTPAKGLRVWERDSRGGGVQKEGGTEAYHYRKPGEAGGAQRKDVGKEKPRSFL